MKIQKSKRKQTALLVSVNSIKNCGSNIPIQKNAECSHFACSFPQGDDLALVALEIKVPYLTAVLEFTLVSVFTKYVPDVPNMFQTCIYRRKFKRIGALI